VFICNTYEKDQYVGGGGGGGAAKFVIKKIAAVPEKINTASRKKRGRQIQCWTKRKYENVTIQLVLC
jgi:hypothetical protein